MKKLDSLQLGRAIAVCMVLFFHLTTLSSEYQHGYFYAPWEQILLAGVDIFFVISGVVMVVTTYRGLGQPGTGKRFLIHRVSRIYPPYLFLTIALTILWLARPGTAINSSTGGVDLWISFTLWPSTKHMPIVQVGWTLTYEMIFYLIFFCMITFFRKAWLLRALVIWAAIVATGCAAIALDSSGTLRRVFPGAAFVFSAYVLEFIAGCFFGFALLKTRLVAAKTCILLGILLFTLEAAFFQLLHLRENYNLIFRGFVFGPPAALLVYGLLAWEAGKGQIHVPRWIIRCGDISYSIYLVHLLVIHFAYRSAWRVFAHTGTVLLFPVVTTFIVLGVSAVFYRLIERPFSLWTRIGLEKIFHVPARAVTTITSVDRVL